LHFLLSENPKENWLTFKIFPKFSLAENFIVPLVYLFSMIFQNCFIRITTSAEMDAAAFTLLY